MTDFARLIQALAEGSVRFILVGGTAARAHGAARITDDLDIVYDRSPENLGRLVAAMAPFQPYLRGAPPGLPFVWDDRTLRNGLNFTLKTTLGDLDALGEIVGGGGYSALEPHSVRIRIFGYECLCLGIEKLIEVKRAAGRPKDFEAIAELEAILEETKR